MNYSRKYVHVVSIFYHVNLIAIGPCVAAGDDSDDLDIRIGKWSESGTKDSDTTRGVVPCSKKNGTGNPRGCGEHLCDLPSSDEQTTCTLICLHTYRIVCPSVIVHYNSSLSPCATRDSILKLDLQLDEDFIAQIHGSSGHNYRH
jgi:hypothetical protein